MADYDRRPAAQSGSGRAFGAARLVPAAIRLLVALQLGTHTRLLRVSVQIA